MEILDLDDPQMPRRPRSYQGEWCDKVRHDRARFNRVLIDAPGGTGKSLVTAKLAFDEWVERHGRTLVIENRDRLCEQIAQEIRDSTALDVEIEKGVQRASPFSPIVVGSLQTLSRLARLTGFADNHFSQIIVDEAHLNTLSDTAQRVLKYFHWGAGSLAEDWKRPDDLHPVNSFVIGTTATPDIGQKRNLGEFYQNVSVRYAFLQAVEDGWLVEPRAYREVLPSAKKLHARYGNTPLGKDLRADDLSKELIPLVSEMADQIKRFATGCKTIAFTPSVECARLLAEACAARGFNAWFVSGECLDRDDKTDAFCASGPNSVLVNCALYVAGWDHPPIDCVAWFRPTTSRAFLLQGLYRGTRVLPGLVSDDMTAAERRAAIAASTKPFFRVIDPLWKSEEIPLCSFYDLYTDKPEVKKKLEQKGGAPDSAAVEKAERDWASSVEKAAKKHRARESQLGVDPLRWAISIGEDRVANYIPKTDADAAPMTKGQEEFLLKAGIKYGHVKCAGQAQQIIDTYLFRQSEGLATPKTIQQLVLRLGWPEEVVAGMKQKQAGVLMAKGVKYKEPSLMSADDPALAYGEG